MKNKRGVHCCKDCQDRREGCHSHCLTYISECEAWEDEKKKIRAEKYKYNDIERYEAKRNEQIKRGRGSR